MLITELLDSGWQDSWHALQSRSFETTILHVLLLDEAADTCPTAASQGARMTDNRGQKMENEIEGALANRTRLALLSLLFVVQFFLASCTGGTGPLISPSPTPLPPSTPTLASTPTPVPTATSSATPTPSPTPTPAVVIYKTPKPRDLAAAEPTPAGDLVASSQHLDFYGELDNYWVQHLEVIAPAIESELEDVAESLQTDLPDERIRISIQGPATSPRVRNMNCPARGLYYGHTESGPLMTIFADESTSRVQVMAVAAHELAHYLIFQRFGNGGDIILSEGLANWASRDTWAPWQGWPSFDAAVREYRRRGIYLSLNETLTFDPDVAQELGLSDCFALRDLRYNEWSSFVGYLINHYGFQVLGQLWQATAEERGPSARRSRSPTVEYESVLGKNLQQLEQEWLASLGDRMQQATRNPQYAVRDIAHSHQ